VKPWKLHPANPSAAGVLARELNTNPLVAQLLLNRGIITAFDARLFLDAPMNALHSPDLLPGIPEAAAIIAQGVVAKQRICIYGDYDVDGTTGTAILYSLLHKLGASVTFYVPHRLDEGYGLNEDAVRELAKEGVQILVTVDCGIASLHEAAVAKSLGLTLIITDHHEMKPNLPEAVLVHPRLPGSKYPFDGLSGSCVAFKLAWAVAQLASGSNRVTDDLRMFLLDAMGLAALGLVADVMPLRGENRIFTKHGLKRLITQPSIGLKALLEEAKLLETLKAEDVSFKLAPRINAAGRLGCARLVVELLTTAQPKKAQEIAQFLEQQNGTRQTLERRITAQAKELVELQDQNAPAIVVGGEDWHQGVVGIVASRLAEHFGKPALVLALKPDGEASPGSGRSYGGVALHTALESCTDLLISHGGHAAAVGFRMKPGLLDALRERFCRAVARATPDGVPPQFLQLDAEVPLTSLSLSLLKDIDKLEPYGAAHPRPKFLASGLKLDGVPKRIGTGERHLSFRVKQGGASIRAVAWGLGERLEELTTATACCVAFTPRLNEWNGQRNVEIEVLDFQTQAVAELN